MRGFKIGWRNIPLLTGFFILATSLFVFVEIAGEVSERETAEIDRRLFMMLRNPADPSDPLGPLWLEEAAAEITALGGYPIITLIVLFVCGFLIAARRWFEAWLVALSISGGALISTILKSIFERPRPDIVEYLDIVHTTSFPSGHAMGTMVAYVTLGGLLFPILPAWRLKIFVLSSALFIALIVGITRVYLGVHWPSDVLAGWVLGAAWVSLCLIIAAWLRKRAAAVANENRREAGNGVEHF